jgi:GrpB protein
MNLAGRIREAPGWRVLQLERVGSTSVPGLAAKPVIDIDLTVADPGREQDYVAELEMIGFKLVIREPRWYGHRALRAGDRPCNLHVSGSTAPSRCCTGSSATGYGQPCACRKSHPCWLSGMPVLVEDTAEAVASADAKAGGGVGLRDW